MTPAAYIRTELRERSWPLLRDLVMWWRRVRSIIQQIAAAWIKCSVPHGGDA